jgi:polysaccharide pyruvyl transferase WcaK-like protein
LGAFGIHNFGNDASLRATFDAVQEHAPRATPVCVCSNPALIREQYGIGTFALHFSPPPTSRLLHSRIWLSRQLARVPREIARWVAMVRHLEGVDLLIVAGTGILDDQHSRASGAPLDLSLWALAAWIRRVPVMMLSVGAGPIDSKFSRLLLRVAARCARAISYRDAASRRYMASIGRDTRADSVCPDLAFSLHYPQAIRGGPPRVAIGVLSEINWLGRSDGYRVYLDRLARLVKSLVSEGCQVVLLVGDFADRSARADLLDRLDTESHLVSAPPVHNYADVIEQLRSCKTVIASRYHILVPALCLGLPVISLEYGFKNTALLAQFDLTQYCHDIDAFDPNLVADQALALSCQTRSPQPYDAYERMKEQVRQQFAKVLEHVG